MARSVGGAALADHYAVVAKQTGKVVEGPPMPAALRYLWNHFVQLDRGRTGNGFGPNPVTWGEIKAYCEVMRVQLDPWEVEALKAVDDAYLASLVDPTT